MPSILKIFDNEGVEIPIPAIQGPAGPTGPAGPNSVSTSTDSSITGLLKGDAGKVAQAIAGTDYATPEDLHQHSNKSDLDLVSGTNTGDQNASAVPYTPSTHVSSTDVQAAITEVGNEVGDAAAVLAAINGDGVVVPTETLIANHNSASDAHTILARKTETMRLLISRTIGAGENVSAITWTQDDAGNALNLIELEVRTYVPSNTLPSGFGYILIRLNDYSGANDYHYSTAATANLMPTAYYAATYGKAIARFKKCGPVFEGDVRFSRNGSGVFFTDGFSIGCNVNMSSITKIYTAISGLTYFPEGTVFEIYGRTA